MNWPVIIVVSILVIILVIFLIIRNVKDEDLVEHHLNEDYHKTPDREGDEDPEEITK